MSELLNLKEKRLTGEERFHRSGVSISLAVANFWQWASSNLAANNLRGHLAEYLVASALDLAGGVRNEWDTCDIRTPKGFQVEVKSAAYIQQWEQSKLSRISFGIAPARGWDSEKQKRTESVQRNSDIYIFCLIETKEQAVFDPTDIDQWVFFVVDTLEINARLAGQKTLSLSRLESLTHIRCRYERLRESVCEQLSVSEL